jgi:hypothetical protein
MKVTSAALGDIVNLTVVDLPVLRKACCYFRTGNNTVRRKMDDSNTNIFCAKRTVMTTEPSTRAGHYHAL